MRKPQQQSRPAAGLALVLCLALASTTLQATAQTGRAPDLQQKLEQSLEELEQVRRGIADRNLPLSKELAEQERRLLQARDELEEARRSLDGRNLDLNNLRARIDAKTKERDYLSNLLGEFVRKFESQLHIVQTHEYQPVIEGAKLALENQDLPAAAVFDSQLEVVAAAIERLHDLMGGTRFPGRAADDAGVLRNGTFLVVGPLAFFESEDDSHVGPVVERLGSLEPNVVAFPPSKARGAGAEDGAPVDFGTMTANTIRTGQGRLPLDATLGKAQQMAETRETLMDHISKGGVVMYPILGLGAFAILVALVKWVQLSLVRMPSERRLMDVCNDLLHHRFEEARQGVQRLSGPLKGMLADALEHVDEPRELIEEVMYEHILETRMKLQRGLPFIAVSASSAPLLGLLGTVTGIISTFRLITVFGSGDVKMLSAGISEALVTTEFGLIVAIPALLIHAFLNRRARGLVDRMEKTAVVVLNKLGRSDAAAFSVGYTDEDRASGYGPTAEAASAPAQG